MGGVTPRPIYIEPIRKACVNDSKAIGNCMWDLFLVRGAFLRRASTKSYRRIEVNPFALRRVL